MRIFCPIMAVFAVLFVLSCGMIAPTLKPYVSAKDGFTITFPAGTKDVVVKKRDPGGEKDKVYMTVNNDGSYRVKVIYWPQLDTSKSLDDDLTGAGATLDRPLDAQSIPTTIAGKPALDETGWSWFDNTGDGSPLVKLQTRVVGLRADKDKVYLIEMKALEKEKLNSKAANDFFNSFKLGADASAK